VGFSFLTTTGQTYVVQQSAGLAPPSWATITNFVGDGGRFELDVSTGPQSAMFLKITTP
jgi:hypothetical protein